MPLRATIEILREDDTVHTLLPGAFSWAEGLLTIDRAQLTLTDQLIRITLVGY